MEEPHATRTPTKAVARSTAINRDLTSLSCPNMGYVLKTSQTLGKIPHVPGSHLLIVPAVTGLSSRFTAPVEVPSDHFCDLISLLVNDVHATHHDLPCQHKVRGLLFIRHAAHMNAINPT